MTTEGVYLDNAASTPVDPAVREAMEPFLGAACGNPSSAHAAGRAVADAVETARRRTADLLHTDPDRIRFTSGGTEGDNWALRGALAAGRRRHIVVSAVEHPAVGRAAQVFARRIPDAEVTTVPVDAAGRVDPDDVGRAIRDDTAVVSVMLVNNEVGTVQPVADCAAHARAHGALFHTDAVQAVGKIPVDPEALGVDLLSLSAHKFHGPKGAGALWLREGVEIPPLLVGGGQEAGDRAGTPNAPGVAGLGRAAALAAASMQADLARVRSLADRLREGLLRSVPEARVHAADAERLPHIVSIAFPGAEGQSLLLALDVEHGIRVSTGSACASGRTEPSPVLAAMAVAAETAETTVRFSLSRMTTEREIDAALAAVPDAVERLRAMNPVWSG